MSIKNTRLFRFANDVSNCAGIRFSVFFTVAIYCSATVSLATTYPGYSFLTVSGNNTAGNGAFSQFSGANGVITVSHSFSSGGAGLDDNNNALINPSQFTTLFPGTGSVQGHLAQTVYAHTSVVTFNFSGYTLTPNTVFGMWNTTDEVTKPAGGSPVYQVQLLNASNTLVPPSSFSYLGNQDNTGAGGVLSHTSLLMNTGSGEVTFGGLTNGGAGTHTDAAFWRNIPVTTKELRVYADLPPLNTIGDGVGYYFAELTVPEPCGLLLFALSVLACGNVVRRRRQ